MAAGFRDLLAWLLFWLSSEEAAPELLPQIVVTGMVALSGARAGLVALPGARAGGAMSAGTKKGLVI